MSLALTNTQSVEEVRNDIIRTYGVRLSRMPDRFRHMPPEHRR